MDANLAFTSAVEMRRLIGSKEVSVPELVEFFYQRIEQLDPRLNAYLALCPDQAMDQARAAQEAVQRGDSLGPLHGIPVSIKDLEMTKGIPTTVGSAVFKDRTPDVDSVVVERIRQAGAIILGKTNTPEFGLSGTTETKVGGPGRNPWNPERTSGGSSGGAAAALASGLCTLASGSDGGGSIRIPASFCGVFGIKPSQGRVPRFGGYGRPAARDCPFLHRQRRPGCQEVRLLDTWLHCGHLPDSSRHWSIFTGEPDPEPAPDKIHRRTWLVQGVRTNGANGLGRQE